MRIRSIKPEFWKSEDIAALDWPTRLLFIGLWSYVDDNGVGRDNEKLIKADLFPLEDDPRETLATVSRGLQTLSEGGQITRYKVTGKTYLHINAWENHQRIDKPNKARYPLPTCDDAVIRETVATSSRDPRETPAPGTEEQGNRGTDLSCASTDVEREFDDWYSSYPRKRARGQALKAYKAARKKVAAAVLTDALAAQLPTLRTKGDFCPYPASWLNGEMWGDEVTAAPSVVTDPAQLPPVADSWMRRRPQ